MGRRNGKEEGEGERGRRKGKGEGEGGRRMEECEKTHIRLVRKTTMRL